MLCCQLQHPVGPFGHSAMIRRQLLDHVTGCRVSIGIVHGGQLRKFAIAARRLPAQGTNAFGDGVHGFGQLHVLLFEQQMQAMEHGAGHIPVILVGLQVQGVALGQQLAQLFCHLLVVLDHPVLHLLDQNLVGPGWPVPKP